MIDNSSGVRFNVKAYDRVVRRIKENGERFDMDVPLEIVAKGSEGVRGRFIRAAVDHHRNPPCKTVGCFGGWACVLNSLDTSIKGIRRNAARVANMGWDSIQAEAIEILGITHAEAETLFHANSWPAPFTQQYAQAKTIKGQQRAGLARFAAFRKEKLAQEKLRAKENKAFQKSEEAYASTC